MAGRSISTFFPPLMHLCKAVNMFQSAHKYLNRGKYVAAPEVKVAEKLLIRKKVWVES